MKAISETFARHHKRCDDAWAEAEEAAQQGRWPEAKAALGRFLTGMRAHLGIEEAALFPAFEGATGMVGGPTAVMRMEHQQMRGLFEELEAAAAKQDAATFAGASETLLVLMQQHNMKEENILYPMCDQALAGDGALIDTLLKGLEGK
jgi:iron-sulfur cluster repair protein YtfE (RIC family)